MFPKKEFSQLPPTQAALLQHARRSVYQASIWLKCMENKVDPPDPSNFGWRLEESRFVPHWTNLPPISTECSALLKCCVRVYHYAQKTVGVRKHGNYLAHIFVIVKENVMSVMY